MTIGQNILAGLIANVISALLVFILGLIFLDRKMAFAPWVYSMFGVKLAGFIQQVYKFLISPWLRVFLLLMSLIGLNLRPSYTIYYSILAFLASLSLLWRPETELKFSPSPKYSEGFNHGLKPNIWQTKTGDPSIEENFGKPPPDLLLKYFSLQATNSFIFLKNLIAERGIVECDIYLEPGAVFNLVFFADINTADHPVGRDNWYMARYDSRTTDSDGFLIKDSGPGVNWRFFKMTGTQTSVKEWHRIRLEFDSNRAAMYKDGQLIMQFDSPQIFGKAIGIFNEIADVHVDNFSLIEKF